MSSLRGKSVLITGASSGIGAQMARELVQRGARVGLLARREERLQELAEELRFAGGEAAWAAADVSAGGDLDAALDQVADDLGAAHVVVANAGYNRPEKPSELKPGRALAVYDTNLLGALRMFQWALPRFLEAGNGQLVGVASVASYLGLPHNAAYCGSKAALRVHLQSLRLSLAGTGVAVTTICPGFVESELTAKHKGKFPMPFMWPTDRAARLMVDAIEDRKAEVVFPWQMRAFVHLFARGPAAVGRGGHSSARRALTRTPIVHAVPSCLLLGALHGGVGDLFPLLQPVP